MKADGDLDAALEVIDLDRYRRERRAALCLHSKVVVLDGNNRSVTCDECKASLDPFDTLVRLTAEWDRVRELRDLRKRLQAHITELKRLADNARAAAKRAGAKDLPFKPI